MFGSICTHPCYSLVRVNGKGPLLRTELSHSPLTPHGSMVTFLVPCARTWAHLGWVICRRDWVKKSKSWTGKSRNHQPEWYRIPWYRKVFFSGCNKLISWRCELFSYVVNMRWYICVNTQTGTDLFLKTSLSFLGHLLLNSSPLVSFNPWTASFSAYRRFWTKLT